MIDDMNILLEQNLLVQQYNYLGNEQLVYGINLYNAMTTELILESYPVEFNRGLFIMRGHL